MTLPAKNSRRVVTNTGSVTTIDVDFPADQAQYVKVYAGLPGRYEMVLGVDYTLTGVAVGSEDFTVTLTDPGGWSDYDLFAVSVEYVVEQPSDVDVGGPFGLRFENALDRLALIMQSLEDRVNRAVKMPITGPVGPGNELTPFPDQLIGWNTEGTALETKPQISQSVQEAIDKAAEAAQSALDAAQSALDAAGIVDAFELSVAGYTVAFNDNAAAKTADFDANADARFDETASFAAKAQEWAENPEDDEVEPGQFSAKHWAAKAEQTVIDGLADASVTIPKLAADVLALIAAAASVGDYVFTAADTAPVGTLKANGAAISRTTYAALFAKIGTTYGVGDGSTTFNLPDIRGEFLRGWDDGRGIDAARAIGSAQSSQNLQHNHGVNDPSHAHSASLAGAGSNFIIGSGPGISLASGITNYAVTGISIQNSGGTEARPRNIAALVCIKY